MNTIHSGHDCPGLQSAVTHECLTPVATHSQLLRVFRPCVLRHSKEVSRNVGTLLVLLNNIFNGVLILILKIATLTY
jgi:hypothetical protein